MYPRFPETLDADAPGSKDFTKEFPLAAGDSLLTCAIDIVDSTSTTIDPAPTTVISQITIGVVTGVPGNVWGVTFRAQGGVAGSLHLRFSYTTAFGVTDHATRMIIVEQR